jgi:hypothetical protein
MQPATYDTSGGNRIPVNVRRRYPYAALGLRCAGASIIYLTPLILIAAGPSQMRLHDFINLIAAFLASNYVGFLCMLQARDLTPPTLEEILADSRGVILYLRNFAEDEKTKVRLRDLLLMPVFPTWSLRGKELHIKRAFGDHGPLIAIGKPGDRTPPIGAYRIFVDDHWHEVVSDLLDRSQLVIIRAAASPGLQWELEQVARRVSPDRVVLFLPFRRSDWQRRYEEFAVIFDRTFPVPLPRKNRSPLVIFDAQWRPWRFRDRWPGYLPRRRESWFARHIAFPALCEYSEQLAQEWAMLFLIVVGTSIQLFINGFFVWMFSRL